VLARGGGGEATAKPLGNCDYICVLFIDTHEADGAAAPEKMMDALTMRALLKDLVDSYMRGKRGTFGGLYVWSFD
jgi:hypothetical protein